MGYCDKQSDSAVVKKKQIAKLSQLSYSINNKTFNWLAAAPQFLPISPSLSESNGALETSKEFPLASVSLSPQEKEGKLPGGRLRDLRPLNSASRNPE